MDDKEVNDWIQNVLDNTHYVDIKTMADALNEALENHRLAITFERVTNMCDKCDITFPEHITECSQCGNNRLRSFRVKNNLVEIFK